ncbi:hypothetical protein FRB96_006617 [Tulasnella sp. 330]|nr:hypothetical protein FRB96_006617 [Tulasnella sp. 330]
MSSSPFCNSLHQRVASVNNSPASPSRSELHHRSLKPASPVPMVHPPTPGFIVSDKDSFFGQQDAHELPLSPPAPVKDDTQPKLFGLPLKYVSLVTLAVQNATLTIIMHYSRVSTPPNRTYSAGSAVLLNELLKGSISICIALMRIDPDDRKSRSSPITHAPNTLLEKSKRSLVSASPRTLQRFVTRWRRLAREVFSTDCWKLSIPAILYVIQNNLQFVAASNLDVATFQVTYQMKILTTAAFSVVMLRKKLTTTKWLSLLGLAVGVGIVQIQTTGGASAAKKVVEAVVPDEMAGEAATEIVHAVAAHVMNPLKGFLAVSAACITSGLAGVYFEMVLKGSQADLWVRNVQLSLFSLLPALVPILLNSSTGPKSAFPWYSEIFRNFGAWAWGTVLVQVFGGLVTAVVIKYSDNIMKGFATSLSIVISFLASVALFDFGITVPFVVGSMVVLGATWFYNAPDKKPNAVAAMVNANAGGGVGGGEGIGLGFQGLQGFTLSSSSLAGRRLSDGPGSPITEDAPILGEVHPRRSPMPTPRSIAKALGRVVGSSQPPSPTDGYQSMHLTAAGGVNGGPILSAPYSTSSQGYFAGGSGTPGNSAPPSRKPSHVNVAGALGMTSIGAPRHGSIVGFESATLVAADGQNGASEIPFKVPRSSSETTTSSGSGTSAGNSTTTVWR